MKKPAALRPVLRRRAAFSLAALLGAAVWLPWTPPARATDYTWTGNGGDGDWINGANWQSGFPPVSSADTFLHFGLVGHTGYAAVLNTSSAYTLGGIQFDGSSVYDLRGGTLTLDNANGGINVSGGDQQFIDNQIVLGAAQTWQINDTSELSLQSVDNAGYTLTLSTDGMGSMNGAISGSGGLTISPSGSGPMSLLGISTYTGVTTISSGASLTLYGSLGRTSTLVNSGATLSLADQASINVGLGSSKTLTVDGTLRLSDFCKIITGVTYIGSSATSNTTGTYSQSDSSNFSSTAPFYVAYATGSTGQATVSAGTFSTGQLLVGYEGIGTFEQTGGSVSNLTSQPNAIIVGYQRYSIGTYNLSGGSLTANASGLAVGVDGAGTFTQSGGTLSNPGTLYLGYGVTGTGTYTLGGGTLTTGTVTGGSGASTFHFNGGTLQAGGSTTNFFSGLSVADVQAGGARIDTQGFNVTVAQSLLNGVTSGPDGGLTKLGSGTLTLTGNSTYTGATTVSAGTLAANNASGSATGAGAVTVQSGATMGGNGTVAGAVTIQSGGTLDPGLSLAPARLTLGSNLALNAGSTLSIELGGTTPGSGYSQVRLAGALTLGGSNLRVVEPAGFSLAVGQTFVLLDNTSTSLTPTGLFANAAAGSLYMDAVGNTFLINYAATADGDLIPNDVTLTVQSTVPEPSTWAAVLGGMGLLGLALRCRRARLA